MAHEFTLPLFNSKLAGLHPRQNLAQMGQMLMCSATEHYDVIHIHTCKGFIASQLLIHETLECTRCIGKPKGRDFEFKQAPFAIECHMVLLLRISFYLVVALL